VKTRDRTRSSCIDKKSEACPGEGGSLGNQWGKKGEKSRRHEGVDGSTKRKIQGPEKEQLKLGDGSLGGDSRKL